MKITDALLRGVLLKRLYDLRHLNGGRVPLSDIDLSGLEQQRPEVVGSICTQLAEAGLIEWKPLIDNSGSVVQGVAKIVALGIDVVDGHTTSPVAIAYPSNDITEEIINNASLEGISPNRILNWERFGVDLIENDLKNKDGIRYVGGTHEVKTQAWRWVNHVREKQRAAELIAKSRLTLKEEPKALTLKPGAFGVSLDLRILGAKLLKWWEKK